MRPLYDFCKGEWYPAEKPKAESLIKSGKNRCMTLTHENEALAALQTARHCLEAAKLNTNTRALVVTITYVDTAILWLREDIREKEFTMDQTTQLDWCTKTHAT